MKVERWFFGVGVVIALLSACGSPGPSGQVTREDFGEAWPFTVHSGKLGCDRGAATIYAGGRGYALNDKALARGWLPPGEILMDGPGFTKGGLGSTSLEPVVARALEICGRA